MTREFGVGVEATYGTEASTIYKANIKSATLEDIKEYILSATIDKSFNDQAYLSFDAIRQVIEGSIDATFLLYLLKGILKYTGATNVDVGVYKHSYTTYDLGDTITSLSSLFEYDSDIARSVSLGNFLKSLTLTKSIKNEALMSFTLLGLPYSSSATTTTSITNQFLDKVTISINGNNVNAQTFNLTFTNDGDHKIGLDNLVKGILNKGLSIALSMTLDYDSNVMTLVKNGTAHDVIITIEGGTITGSYKYKMTITINNMIVQGDTKVTGKDNKVLNLVYQNKFTGLTVDIQHDIATI